MEIDVAVFLACGQAIASGMTVSWWCWWCAYSGSAPATLSCWLAVKQQRFPASQTRLFPFICPPETQPTLWCTFVFKGPILHLFFFQIQICKNYLDLQKQPTWSCVSSLLLQRMPGRTLHVSGRRRKQRLAGGVNNHRMVSMRYQRHLWHHHKRSKRWNIHLLVTSLMWYKHLWYVFCIIWHLEEVVCFSNLSTWSLCVLQNCEPRLTALPGSMRGLSMAMVMQLRKMITNTMWSNILWEMILLHTYRNLTENKEKKKWVKLGACLWNDGRLELLKILIEFGNLYESQGCVSS